MSQNQFEIQYGERLRDRGMKLASDHAYETHSNWTFIAYVHLVKWLSFKPQGFRFMTEDFRAYLKSHLVAPPRAQAFGSIMRKAAKAGLIEAAGFEKSNNSVAHLRPTQVWKKK